MESYGIFLRRTCPARHWFPKNRCSAHSAKQRLVKYRRESRLRRHQGESDLRSSLRELAAGDHPKGKGDPSLCMFPRNVTPSHHKLAEQFVLLDNMYCNGQVSRDGHPWSSWRTTPITTREIGT